MALCEIGCVTKLRTNIFPLPSPYSLLHLSVSAAPPHAARSTHHSHSSGRIPSARVRVVNRNFRPKPRDNPRLPCDNPGCIENSPCFAG